MPEILVKYLLAIKYEMFLLKSSEDRRKNYDYKKFLETDQLSNIVDIYNYLPDQKQFEKLQDEKYTCFGSFKVIEIPT